MDGHDRPGQFMALLLCLGMTAALALGCLHCDPNFSKKFSFYRHHVNLKSWWVGDIPVSGVLLTEWSQNTMKELHLAIPAEISERRSPSQGQEKSNRGPRAGQLICFLSLPPSAREKLDQVAGAVYQRMDQLYQGKMYFPGYFPNELRAIFREQVRLIQNAIIESRIDCQRHCGIFQYETISCINCTDSRVVCFGYYCKSSTQWQSAVQGLLSYINTWHNQDTSTRTTPAFLSPSIRCLEVQHLLNLTLENASECLTQH